MIRTAFVLGAGLGTRLRPLTDLLPKPLIPVFQKPLITFAFDHLLSLGINRLIVNTHHLSERYDEAFPDYRYRGHEILFRHERVLLETGGAIKNIEQLVGGETFIVHSGDILTDLPIQAAIDAHRRSGRLVTLILRSGGGLLQVALDKATGNILDIGNRLGTAPDAQKFLYASIALLEPEIFAHIPEQEKISIVPIWTDLIRDQPGSVGGVILDQGNWWDLGQVDRYLDVHRFFSRPGYRFDIPVDKNWPQRIHPSAKVSGVTLTGTISIDADVELAPGTELTDIVIWPETKFSSPIRCSNGILTPIGFVTA